MKGRLIGAEIVDHRQRVARMLAQSRRLAERTQALDAL